jgi:hypothetical protein
MLDEREAIVVEVRPWDAHGAGFVDVSVVYPDRTLETTRLGRESAPSDLEAGERVKVRLVMGSIVEVVRPAPGTQG